MRDKTSIIRTELEKMLINKEIPSSIVPEISNMVEYLKTNNIFKYETKISRRMFSRNFRSLGYSKATILVPKNN